MDKLFWKTITENMRSVLNGFFQTEPAGHFYLAGGTALALQIGHRLSVDLDFFSPTEDIPGIRPQLEKALAPFQPTLADSSWGNLVYLVRDVRVGFYGYGYSMVAPFTESDGIKLASVEDIALMKLDALLGRAARKDFYDLYFICQNMPLRRILDQAPQKYPSVRDFEAQSVKRLVYFENAETETDPILLMKTDWGSIKEYFIQQAKQIEQSWLV